MLYSSKSFVAKLAYFMFVFLMTRTQVVDAQDKITGPWLWMIAPTALTQGGARSTDVDSLALASDGTVTEAQVAANGANEGDAVGNFAWTLAEIDSDVGTGLGNVNNVVNRIGWAIGNVDDYTSYALITIESEIDQRVPMLVGSDDSIKVWLNGEVVHNNPIDRPSSGFQDLFMVNLVAGDNLLMVKVSERGGGWVMFVGIDADVNAVYKPRDIFLSISPLPIASPPVGEQFVVSIDIANGRNIRGYQLTLTFDTTALRYVSSIQSTGYMPTKTLTVSPKVKGNNVTLAAISFGDTSQGNGTLAHVTFEVIAYKASTLVLGDVGLVNSQGDALPVSTENGKVIQLVGDVNSNGVVNIQDLVLVANSFGQMGKTRADINSDGIVNIVDLVLVAGAMESSPAAPSVYTQSWRILSSMDIRQWLFQAHQFSIDDTRYQRGILILEYLLAALPPKETVLLPNYPNPFNPETWIPYQLVESSDVTVFIHTIDGQLVRILALGQLPAGVYQDKSRAAYWDGRNERSEPVASGVYFYTLSAGDFTATRKMLIRK